MRLAKVSLVVLAVQLALVSSIAGKYLYERWTCPRVWTRTVHFDPELPMRGRYLSMQLVVDGCQSTLPSAAEATMPRNKDGVQTGTRYSVVAEGPVQFPAKLKAEGGRLVAIRIPDPDSENAGQMVAAWPGTACDNLRLDAPVDFYLPEHAEVPRRMAAGQELWVEVTLPPKGPPRPVQLALKDAGGWKPLAYQ